MHEKLKEQIKDVIAAQSKEVPLFWCGMAQVNMAQVTLIFSFLMRNGIRICRTYHICNYIKSKVIQAVLK